jgi:CheY-like chemotaxis protein
MVAEDGLAPGRERVILIVEDEADVRQLLQFILKRAGFSTLTARDGGEALALVGQQEGRVDLVLADVMMPVLDGPSLARRLAVDWPTLPVLFMTGYPASVLASLGVLPEHAPRIEKPFRIRDLVTRVLEAMGP